MARLQASGAERSPSLGDDPVPRGLSIIIVNWNHGTFLTTCLDALLADAKSLERNLRTVKALVVDNGSTDGSIGSLAQTHPSVRVLRLHENHGFSYALNYGIGATDGDLILSLNPDVVVRPGFLQSLVGGLQLAGARTDERIGAAAPKLLRADDPAFLDSTGLFVDRRRRPYDRGQGELDRGQYDQQTSVFGPCGAAALYRREMLLDTAVAGEPFDPAFFAYCEDADLAWRAQLYGWRCVYVPSAVATHVRGWGDTLRQPGHARTGSRGPRLALRNRYLMTLKNDACRYAVRDLPWMLAAELPRLAYAAVTAPRVLLAVVDLARAWPSAVRSRRQIRGRRAVDDASLRHWFTATHRLSAPRWRGKTAR